MQGKAERGKKQRAGPVGKEQSMVGEAKENAEKWILFLSVAVWE